MSQSEGIDFESRIDELFQVPLREFVVMRKKLAGELRAAGERKLAAEVQSLGKPSLSAWAVNQVYWKAADDFQKLNEVAERLAVVQGAPGETAKGELQEVMGERRRVLARVLDLSQTFLREQGHSTGSEILKRIAASFEAVLAHGNELGKPPLGRLEQDLPSPGFDVLLTRTAPVGGSPTSGLKGAKEASATPSPKARATAQARAAFERSQQKLEGLRGRFQEARSEERRLVQSLEAETRERVLLENRLAATRRRQSRLQAELQKARQQTAQLESEVREAEEHVSTAQKSLEKAQAETPPQAS